MKRLNLSYLASGVDYLSRIVLIFVPDCLTEGIFNGGIVGLDKVMLNKLNSQRRFS
jgi:hypothetical protein